MKTNSIIKLIFKLLIGVLIILAPVIITGHWYNESKIMEALLVSDFVMRTLSFIIGLLVIYDSIKSYPR